MSSFGKGPGRVSTAGRAGRPALGGGCGTHRLVPLLRRLRLGNPGVLPAGLIHRGPRLAVLRARLQRRHCGRQHLPRRARIQRDGRLRPGERSRVTPSRLLRQLPPGAGRPNVPRVPDELRSDPDNGRDAGRRAERAGCPGDHHGFGLRPIPAPTASRSAPAMSQPNARPPPRARPRCHRERAAPSTS